MGYDNKATLDVIKHLNHLINESTKEIVVPDHIEDIERQIQSQIDATIENLNKASVILALQEIKKNKLLYIGLICENEFGLLSEPIDDPIYSRKLIEFSYHEKRNVISASNTNEIDIALSTKVKTIKLALYTDLTSKQCIADIPATGNTNVAHLYFSAGNISIKHIKKTKPRIIMN
jgi:hypothetical protein